MPGFFRIGEQKAAKITATTVPSSSIKPQQKRRHSDQVQSESSRPSILSSKTWHNYSIGEPSPKLPKSPKQKERVKQFFGISRGPNDEDDEGLEFMCIGDKAVIPKAQKGSSSRDNTSRQTHLNTLGQVPVPIRSHPKAGQTQRKVSNQSTVEPKKPSGRSSLQESRTPRKSFAPSTIPKSPYQNVSKTSHTNPRSRDDVYDPRDRTEDSDAGSNQGKHRRGRDGSNSRRNRERDMKVQSPDGSISSSSRYPIDEKRAQSRYKNNSDNRSDYNSSSKQHKLSSGRRENHKSSDPEAAGNRDKNGHVARVAPDGRKPGYYEVHLYKEDLSSIEKGRGVYKRENLV